MPEDKMLHTVLMELISYAAIKLQGDGINLLPALISREVPPPFFY
jgi:hypothetical protein